MIKFKTKGSFKHTENFIKNAREKSIINILNKYAYKGVLALSQATPVLTGLAASSWGYQISKDDRGYIISWTNDDIEGGPPVVLLLQYGHATTAGTWVEGHDFINPAIAPVMEEIAEKAWKEIIDT